MSRSRDAQHQHVQHVLLTQACSLDLSKGTESLCAVGNVDSHLRQEAGQRLLCSAINQSG